MNSPRCDCCKCRIDRRTPTPPLVYEPNHYLGNRGALFNFCKRCFKKYAARTFAGWRLIVLFWEVN